MKRQQQKQRSLVPSAFSNRSIFGDRRKRRRDQGDDVISESKEKLTLQQREEILAEEQKKSLDQIVSGIVRNGKYAEAGKGKKKHVEIEARNAYLNFKGKMKKNQEKIKKNHVEANEEATYKVKSEEDQGEQEKDGEAKRKTRDEKISRELYNQLCNKQDAALKEVKDVVKKLLKDTHFEVSAMLQGRFYQHRVKFSSIQQ